ncbi:hypothetical protein SGRA_1063 [Saprospira grandis str. Lewin]|uniref:Uncharacterized protein n=1 Tax=Saprospira grandis (strain Lewin) TaxID=984262 RepID=H6L3F1_SAPGL|nr:hypothetical protein SGRA_1063 [Saprospira grandis str. Lewin]
MDSLGNPLEGRVGGLILRNEERSDEYRLKGAVLGPKATATKNAHRMSGLGICSRAAKPPSQRAKPAQGRADLRAAQ